MTDIIETKKRASIEIKSIIEEGDTSKSENQNSTGDTQLKLDILSDVVIVEYVTLNRTHMIASVSVRKLKAALGCVY